MQPTYPFVGHFSLCPRYEALGTPYTALRVLFFIAPGFVPRAAALMLTMAVSRLFSLA